MTIDDLIHTKQGFYSLSARKYHLIFQNVFFAIHGIVKYIKVESINIEYNAQLYSKNI